MTIPLQKDIIYGPLKSRRFGTSLGVNLLPKNKKICNFNCVYCQYSQSRLTKNAVFPTVQEIEEEMTQFALKAKKQGRAIDWITIAGNGEPTLHPKFPEVVKRLLSVRDAFLPGVPVGILSNSSTCHRLEIRQALARLDGRFMKLDAGSPAVFKNINRPLGFAEWGEVASGLRELKNIVLQSLFFEGDERNIAPSQVGDWINAVGRIQPKSVQIYTIDRPTQLEGLRPVSKDSLQRIASDMTRQTGVPGDVY